MPIHAYICTGVAGAVRSLCGILGLSDLLISVAAFSFGMNWHCVDIMIWYDMMWYCIVLCYDILYYIHFFIYLFIYTYTYIFLLFIFLFLFLAAVASEIFKIRSSNIKSQRTRVNDGPTMYDLMKFKGKYCNVTYVHYLNLIDVFNLW